MRAIMTKNVIGSTNAASTTLAAGRRRGLWNRGMVGLSSGSGAFPASPISRRLVRGDLHDAAAQQRLLLGDEGELRNGVERPGHLRLDVPGRRRRGGRERPSCGTGIVKGH